MKNKFLYWGLGALVGGIIAIMISVSLASPGAPNPGHALSCHTVINEGEDTSVAWTTVSCDYGTRTGGGCSLSGSSEEYLWQSFPDPEDSDQWICRKHRADEYNMWAFVICCEAI